MANGRTLPVQMKVTQEIKAMHNKIVLFENYFGVVVIRK